MNNAEVTKAVVKVGGGRGFIIQSGHNRLVVTAAHCLPHLPPCHGANNTDERTYPNLFGPLGSRKPKVWAKCVFADPVGDIAVLGSPDGQVLSGEAAAYEALTHETPTFRIGDAPRKGRAWLLSLAMHWHPCVVEHIDGPLWIEEAADGIHAMRSHIQGARTGSLCTGLSANSPRRPDRRGFSFARSDDSPSWGSDNVAAEYSGPRQFEVPQSPGAGLLKHNVRNSPRWPHWRGFSLP